LKAGCLLFFDAIKKIYSILKLILFLTLTPFKNNSLSLSLSLSLPYITSIAVDVITIIKNSHQKATHIVLVIQYRPALSAYCLEFPSGLIDADESPETAALRELEEETGFGAQAGHSLKVVKVGVPVSYEPGLTGSCSRIVVVEVNVFFRIEESSKEKRR
jgi:8-oxo-dGTP pyrophosphatase MutT (NUDIX family)